MGTYSFDKNMFNNEISLAHTFLFVSSITRAQGKEHDSQNNKRSLCSQPEAFNKSLLSSWFDYVTSIHPCFSKLFEKQFM